MVGERILKAGIVGLGLAGRAHLAGYIFNPNVELVAVSDADSRRAWQYVNEYNLDVQILSFEDLLKSDVDIIDLCTPTYLHGAMTRQAAGAGKHIHCEKPFCSSVSDGIKACQAVRNAGVKLLVGETYVFLTSHVKARELIDSGEIGRPLQIRQRFGNWILRKGLKLEPSSKDPEWRVDPVKSCGGQYSWIFDHAVHLFSAAEYFMQDIPIHEVYAVTATTKCMPDKHPLDYQVYGIPDIDIPIITWKYEDTDLQGLWARAEKLNGKYDHMTGFSSLILGERGSIEVLGEGGSNLLWDGKQRHILLHREGKETMGLCIDEGSDAVWESDINYYPQGHMNHVNHLIECILNDTEPRYGGEAGMHAVTCTLAAIRSAQEGRPVKIGEITPDYTAY